MGGIQRLHLIYPYYLFRARINYKNIAEAEPWAEGQLYFDDEDGQFYIIDRNNSAPDGYSLKYILTETVGLWTFFSNGSKKNIYENDVLRITKIDTSASSETDFLSPEELIKQLQKSESKDEDDGKPEIHASIPKKARILSQITGDVCIAGGMAVVRHLDYASGQFMFEPLYSYFSNDFLPFPEYVVETLGNTIDSPEILDEIFNSELKTGFSHEVNNVQKLVM